MEDASPWTSCRSLRGAILLWYISPMFVDSHCHLEMELFGEDRREVIERSAAEGLSHILTVGTQESHFKKVIDIIEEHPFIYGAVGIHPHNSSDLNNKVLERIESLLTHDKIVALGEIGLDFFKNRSPRQTQIDTFIRQIAVAKKVRIPIIIHSRDAKEETLSILTNEDAQATGGVIHCYSYDTGFAKKVLDMGFYISFPGTITYKKAEAIIEAAKYVPLDRILVETDAPFLTPHPYRGKRNEPRHVKITTEKIAAIKNKKTEDMALIIRDNFVTLFLNRGEET